MATETVWMQKSEERSKGTQTLLLTALPLQEIKGRMEEIRLESRTQRGRVKARATTLGTQDTHALRPHVWDMERCKSIGLRSSKAGLTGC